MHTVLFNFNDVALLLVIFECLLLGALLLVLNPERQLSQYLLGIFLAAIGLDALDTLLYWSINFKNYIYSGIIYPFFIFKFSVFVAAPTLYLYVKSTLYCDFFLTKKNLIHFLPTLLFPFFLLLLFVSLESSKLQRSLFDYDILFNSPLFQSYLWARNVAYVGYGLASIILIAKYREQLKQGFSSIDEIDQSWLKILVGGFLAIWAGVFASYIGHKVFDSFVFSNTLGVVGNYLNFIFVNYLVVYNLVKSNLFQGIKQSKNDKKGVGNIAIDKHHVQVLVKAMEEDQLYLDPALTLEELARHLSLGSRYVSAIINSHFQRNFFEFVNEYRLKKSQMLLELRDPPIPMGTIMEKSGFNSKATFNRYFKKATGITPTEYRIKCSKKRYVWQSQNLS